jgi:hypothetical protein
MKNKLKHVTAVLLTVGGVALFGAGSAYAQPAFVNGSFETDAWSPGTTDHVTPSGWNAVQSSDERFVQGVHNTSDTAQQYTPYGNQFIELCAGDCLGETIGNVSQAVSGFTVGQQYTLSFAHSPESSGENDVVEVTIAGAGSLSQVFSSSDLGGYWSEWKTQSWTFTADSPTLTFTFAGTVINNNSGDDNWESGIDNITLSGGATTAVPTLPEWGVMLLTGVLALVAFFTLRRRLQ